VRAHGNILTSARAVKVSFGRLRGVDSPRAAASTHAAGGYTTWRVEVSLLNFRLGLGTSVLGKFEDFWVLLNPLLIIAYPVFWSLKSPL
jgi:hypothetical protein